MAPTVLGQAGDGDDSKAALLPSPLIHFAIPDGSCRLVPEQDLKDRTRLVLWTRLHARYELRAKNEVAEVDGAGLLHNKQWCDLVVSALEPDFDRALGRLHDDLGYSHLARLLVDCPPLLFLDTVRERVAKALAERETLFGEVLRRGLANNQRDAVRGADSRLRTKSIRDWELIERRRAALMSPDGPPDVTKMCEILATERHPESPKAILKEAGRLDTNHRRAQERADMGYGMMALGCPGAQPAGLHPKTEAQHGIPRLELRGGGGTATTFLQVMVVGLITVLKTACGTGAGGAGGVTSRSPPETKEAGDKRKVAPPAPPTPPKRS